MHQCSFGKKNRSAFEFRILRYWECTILNANIRQLKVIFSFKALVEGHSNRNFLLVSLKEEVVFSSITEKSS